MTPLVSLIVPIYNRNPTFLAECLQSVESQTLPKSTFEVIVFDDGSDLYVEENGKIATSLKNSRYFRRNINKGPSITRNQAIEESKGRLVIPVDGDDFLSPKSLEATLGFIEQNSQVKYSYSQLQVVNKEGVITEDVPGRPYDSDLLGHMNFVGHLKCFDRVVHDSFGGYDPELRFAEDWDHALKASEILGIEEFMQNPQYLYFYRVHGEDQLTAVKKEKLMDVRMKVINSALKRRGIDAKSYFSHVTSDGYTYMDWRENEAPSDSK